MESHYFHTTCPWSILEILRTGVFKPFSAAKSNGDNGINLFRNDEKYWPRQPARTGARLHVAWNGETEDSPHDVKLAYRPNVLRHEAPWRCFLPPGSTFGLRVTRVEFFEGSLDELVGKPPYWHYALPPSLRRNLLRGSKLRLLRSMRGTFRGESLRIKIASHGLTESHF